MQLKKNEIIMSKNPLGFDPNDRGRIKIDAIINCVNRESNFRRNINDQFGLRLNT